MIQINTAQEQAIVPIDVVHNLDGRQFRIFMAYNARVGRWYLNLYELPSGELILAGKSVLLDTPILRNHANEKMPPGELILVSTSENVDPGFENLDNYNLIYITASEVADGA